MKIYILVLLLASSSVCFAGSAEGKSSIGKEEFDEGFMYYSTAAEPEYGKIDRETIELAIKSFRKSAELGHAEAQYYLGIIYATGYGVTKNDNEAVKWLRKSAEQENANAQNFIGSLYENGRGIAKDEKLAVILYRLAAEQGNANAQNNLATMYEKGKGIAKDEKQAVILYRRAAEQGNVNAQNNLGIMYEQGRGIAKDDEQAVILYRRAAEQGNANAQKNLGTMYEKGKGIKSNWVIAQMLYGLAANNDDEVAVEYQVELSKRLTSAQISEAHALGANWKVNMPLPSRAKSDPSSEAKNKIIAAEIQQQKAAKAQQVNAEIQRRKSIPYTAIVSCGYGGNNFPIVACFEKSQLKLTYNNISMTYGVYEFVTGNRPGDMDSNYAMSIDLPKHFHLVAENSNASLILSVKVIDSKGTVIFKDQASQWGSVNVKN